MPELAVLLIDDDARLTALLSEYLGKHGIRVQVATDGEHGLRALKKGGVDVVVLDLMLPGIDGLEVCQRIRMDGALAQTPVLMLTAKGDDVDKVVGLELGADDYVAKPFNPRELLARLRALARRAASPAASAERWAAAGLVINFSAREVTVDGRREILTHFEFELLKLLAQSEGRVLSREQIMDALKGEDLDSFDRSIDVHISRLRAKIERDPREPRFIKTVRGVGYVFTRPD
jgi:two-component system phosphate regulon response regulator OmpR